jgi:hypothetical protein
MIQITPHMRILVAVEAVDFRCGIDALARLRRLDRPAPAWCPALRLPQEIVVLLLPSELQILP